MRSSKKEQSTAATIQLAGIPATPDAAGSAVETKTARFRWTIADHCHAADWALAAGFFGPRSTTTITRSAPLLLLSQSDDGCGGGSSGVDSSGVAGGLGQSQQQQQQRQQQQQQQQQQNQDQDSSKSLELARGVLQSVLAEYPEALAAVRNALRAARARMEKEAAAESRPPRVPVAAGEEEDGRGNCCSQCGGSYPGGSTPR